MSSKYKEIRVIGTGSFGQAILVQRIRDGLLLVMKKINIKDMDEKEKKGTELEVRVLQMLRHANVIAHRESFVSEDGHLCIVMDYADGGDLYQRIQKAKTSFSEEVILDWFIQICMGLHHIHSANILHRDLKTQNIFLTKRNVVKIGDMGIARILDGRTDFAQTVIGTPFYLSPEICEDKPYNRKSDVWSLGCVLYEMMTRKHAFTGKNLPALIMKILQGKYPPIPELYSDTLKNLVSKMLNIDPQQRPDVQQILELPFVRRRMQSMLSERATENPPSAGPSILQPPVVTSSSSAAAPEQQIDSSNHENDEELRRDQASQLQQARKLRRERADWFSKKEEEINRISAQLKSPSRPASSACAPVMPEGESPSPTPLPLPVRRQLQPVVTSSSSSSSSSSQQQQQPSQSKVSKPVSSVLPAPAVKSSRASLGGLPSVSSSVSAAVAAPKKAGLDLSAIFSADPEAKKKHDAILKEREAKKMQSEKAKLAQESESKRQGELRRLEAEKKQMEVQRLLDEKERKAKEYMEQKKEKDAQKEREREEMKKKMQADMEKFKNAKSRIDKPRQSIGSLLPEQPAAPSPSDSHESSSSPDSEREPLVLSPSVSAVHESNNNVSPTKKPKQAADPRRSELQQFLREQRRKSDIGGGVKSPNGEAGAGALEVLVFESSPCPITAAASASQQPKEKSVIVTATILPAAPIPTISAAPIPSSSRPQQIPPRNKRVSLGGKRDIPVEIVLPAHMKKLLEEEEEDNSSSSSSSSSPAVASALLPPPPSVTSSKVASYSSDSEVSSASCAPTVSSAPITRRSSLPPKPIPPFPQLPPPPPPPPSNIPSSAVLGSLPSLPLQMLPDVNQLMAQSFKKLDLKSPLNYDDDGDDDNGDDGIDDDEDDQGWDSDEGRARLDEISDHQDRLEEELKYSETVNRFGKMGKLSKKMESVWEERDKMDNSEMLQEMQTLLHSLPSSEQGESSNSLALSSSIAPVDQEQGQPGLLSPPTAQGLNGSFSSDFGFSPQSTLDSAKLHIRVSGLRTLCESIFGSEFEKVYTHLKQIGSSDADDDDMGLLHILGARCDLLPSLRFINQLIYCEDRLERAIAQQK